MQILIIDGGPDGEAMVKGAASSVEITPNSKVAVQVSRAQERLTAHPCHQKSLGWGMGVTAGQGPVREAIRG